MLGNKCDLPPRVNEYGEIKREPLLYRLLIVGLMILNEIIFKSCDYEIIYVLTIKKDKISLKTKKKASLTSNRILFNKGICF